MKKETKIFLLIMIIFFVALFIIYFLFFQMPLEVKTVKMEVIVSNYTGFNVDTNAIYFGTIPGKGSAERTFNLSNTLNEKIFVNFIPKGNISNFISFSKNNFVIEPGYVDKIKITVTIPEGTGFGEYSGDLEILFRRSI